MRPNTMVWAEVQDPNFERHVFPLTSKFNSITSLERWVAAILGVLLPFDY